MLLRVRLHARTVTLPNGVPVLAMYPNSVKVPPPLPAGSPSGSVLIDDTTNACQLIREVDYSPLIWRGCMPHWVGGKEGGRVGDGDPFARHAYAPPSPPPLQVQHSCDPNLLYFADGATLLYRALRPIAPGDLLTTAYIEARGARAGGGGRIAMRGNQPPPLRDPETSPQTPLSAIDPSGRLDGPSVAEPTTTLGRGDGWWHGEVDGELVCS